MLGFHWCGTVCTNLYVRLCQVSKEDLGRAVRLVLFNQIVVGIPVAMVVFQAMKWHGCSLMPDDLPTFHWALLELIICVLVEEICFYYSHRLDTKRGEKVCVCVYMRIGGDLLLLFKQVQHREGERGSVCTSVCACILMDEICFYSSHGLDTEEESVTVCVCVCIYSWLLHFLLLWTSHLEFTPTRL